MTLEQTIATQFKEIKNEIKGLSQKVDEQFPSMMMDYKAEVVGNIMHTSKLEAQITTLADMFNKQHAAQTKSCQEVSNLMTLRVDEMESKAREKSDVYDAIQSNVDAISQIVAQQVAVFESRCNQNTEAFTNLNLRLEQIQEQINEQDRLKMDRYFL